MADKRTVETAEASVEVEVTTAVTPAEDPKVATGAPEPTAKPTDVAASAESPESTEKLVKRKSLFNKIGGVGKRKDAPKSNDIPVPAVAATETGPAETAAATTEPTVPETATPAAKAAEPAAAPEESKVAVVADEKPEVAATAAADKPKPAKRVSLFAFATGGGKKKPADVIPDAAKDAAVAAKDKVVAAATAVVESEPVTEIIKEEVIVYDTVKTEETAKQHKNFKSFLTSWFPKKSVEKKTTETEIVEEEVVSDTPVAAGAEDAAPKSVDVATETSEPPATTVTSAPAKAEEPVKPVEPAKSVEPVKPAEPATEVIAPKTEDAAATTAETKASE